MLLEANPFCKQASASTRFRAFHAHIPGLVGMKLCNASFHSIIHPSCYGNRQAILKILLSGPRTRIDASHVPGRWNPEIMWHVYVTTTWRYLIIFLTPLYKDGIISVQSASIFPWLPQLVVLCYSSPNAQKSNLTHTVDIVIALFFTRH